MICFEGMSLLELHLRRPASLGLFIVVHAENASCLPSF